MSRFQLIITPDGRSMLTTKDVLNRDQAERLFKEFERWRGLNAVLVMADTEIVRVLDIELDPAIEAPA